MSTLHHTQDLEEPALPPGFDPTRDVMRPPQAPALPVRYESLGGRAAAATAVFGLLLALDVVAVGSSLLEVQLLDRLAAGENVTDAQLDGRIAFPDLRDNPTLPQLRQDSVNYMISDGFDIAVIALAILTIRVVTKRQETRAEEIAAVPPQPAPGTPDSTPPPAEPAAPQPA